MSLLMLLRVLIPCILLANAALALDMPPPETLKRITICSDDEKGELLRICEWVDEKVVKKIRNAVATSAPSKGSRAILESGPILVFSDASGKPIIGFMQTLDGWLVAHEIKVNNTTWRLGKELTKPGGHLRPSKEYTAWELIYKTWLLSVNPERFEEEQAKESRRSEHGVDPK